LQKPENIVKEKKALTIPFTRRRGEEEGTIGKVHTGTTGSTISQELTEVMI